MLSINATDHDLMDAIQCVVDLPQWEVFEREDKLPVRESHNRMIRLLSFSDVSLTSSFLHQTQETLGQCNSACRTFLEQAKNHSNFEIEEAHNVLHNHLFGLQKIVRALFRNRIHPELPTPPIVLIRWMIRRDLLEVLDIQGATHENSVTLEDELIKYSR